MIFAFTIPTESIASWDCFSALNKQAISDAISVSPTDLKNILTAFEDTMLKQVDVLHNTSKPDRKSFKSYYKDIVEVAKDRDSRRNEYVARNMAAITTYIFDAYCPIKVSFCDENEILKRASVIYDGYSPSPDYSNIAQPAFDMQRQLSGEVTKMLPFYNTLVNEILDLWVTIWKDAGRDISGLPKENTLVRSVNTKKEEKKETVNNSENRGKAVEGSEAEKAKEYVFPDDDLQKYKTDQTTVNALREDRRRLAEIRTRLQEIEVEKDKAELSDGHPDCKRLTDESRRLHIEMDQIELRLIQRETD